MTASPDPNFDPHLFFAPAEAIGDAQEPYICQFDVEPNAGENHINLSRRVEASSKSEAEKKVRQLIEKDGRKITQIKSVRPEKNHVIGDGEIGIPVGTTVKINTPGIRGHGETGKVLSKRDGHLQIQSGPGENTNYMIPESKVVRKDSADKLDACLAMADSIARGDGYSSAECQRKVVALKRRLKDEDYDTEAERQKLLKDIRYWEQEAED